MVLDRNNALANLSMMGSRAQFGHDNSRSAGGYRANAGYKGLTPEKTAKNQIPGLWQPRCLPQRDVIVRKRDQINHFYDRGH